MASAAVCCDVNFIREQFAPLPAIESVHVLFRDNICRITVAIPKKDYSLEDRIYDAQYAVMAHAPGLLIDLNIVVLGERTLDEVVSSVGQTVFLRVA